MQVYSGNRNRAAKSKSASMHDMFDCFAKSFAKNIKRVVRQEGKAIIRKEMLVPDDLSMMLPEEVAYEFRDNCKLSYAAVLQNEYENPHEHGMFCRMEELSIRENYKNDIDKAEYALYCAGLPNRFTDDHDYGYDPVYEYPQDYDHDFIYWPTSISKENNMTNKEKILDMICDLHRYGVDVDQYEFGLPIHDNEHVEAMTKLVEDCFKTLTNTQKNPIVIDCFAVYETDGYSNTNFAYAATQDVASKIVGKNHYRGYTHFQKSFHIHDSLESYEQNTQAGKIAAAKAKLTTEELQLLGLE